MAKLSTPSAAPITEATPSASNPSAKALPALQAALSLLAQSASEQDLPTGALYMVATPIGNRADFSVRALWVLAMADAIACEDTRHTRQLLQACGLDRSVPMLAVHQHNEAEAAAGVVERLQRGERVAYASDAGTPAVSDPGARLAAAVAAAGLRVVPLPGASSVTTVLSAAGVASTLAQMWQKGSSAASSFVFDVFLPSKPGERRVAVARLAQRVVRAGAADQTHAGQRARRRGLNPPTAPVHAMSGTRGWTRVCTACRRAQPNDKWYTARG